MNNLYSIAFSMLKCAPLRSTKYNSLYYYFIEYYG